MAYLYQWFWEINCGRPVSTGGYLPLPATEIAAWCGLRNVKLQQWELDAIRSLDTAFMHVAHSKEQA